MWFGMPRVGDVPIEVSCGQCIGCRLERSRQWAVRCLHENQMHESSSFITLTYDDEHLPVDHSLSYRDFQLFMKRLRKHFGQQFLERGRSTNSVRFFMCGEYGELTKRPHFHACLFGLDFDDKEFYKSLPSGSRLYTSAILEKLWPFGFSSIGDVTFESAAYVARYVVKKITGPRAHEHYSFTTVDGEVVQRVPEFTHMSLKPGIGATWFAKYGGEVFPRDEVVVRGIRMKPPKYYDNLLEAKDLPSFEFVQYDRYKKSLIFAEDATRERLRVRERVKKARLVFKCRTLE